MNFENQENKKEMNPLSSEGLREWGGELKVFLADLERCITNIKANFEQESDPDRRRELQKNIDELQAELDGFKEFIGDIDTGDFKNAKQEV